MNDDMSEMFDSVKKMVDSGNIPDNLKEMLGNFNASNTSNTSHSSDNASSNSDFSSMLSSLLSSNNSTSDNTSNNNSNNGSNNGSNDFNIDINTILKMKSIIEAMNKKDDPRANLLYSLKPYLRESRKSKLDQYVNLLNMTKIADIMKNEKKENNNNA